MHKTLFLKKTKDQTTFEICHFFETKKMQHFPCQIWSIVIKVRQKIFVESSSIESMLSKQ